MNEKFWITEVQLSGAIMTSFSVLMLAFTVILQYNRLTGYLRHITQ